MTCISIGFALKKQVVVGVVYNPVLDELFTAKRGGGAFFNGKPISVSTRSSLKVIAHTSFTKAQHALVATGFPYDRSDESLDTALAILKKVLQSCRAVRRGGSAALDMYPIILFSFSQILRCYVAAGITDLYYERGIHAWDVAAGILLVEVDIYGAIVLIS
jgi:myo-inositol-1(or 4)-monophosphatase